MRGAGPGLVPQGIEHPGGDQLARGEGGDAGRVRGDRLGGQPPGRTRRRDPLAGSEEGVAGARTGWARPARTCPPPGGVRAVPGAPAPESGAGRRSAYPPSGGRRRWSARGPEWSGRPSRARPRRRAGRARPDSRRLPCRSGRRPASAGRRRAPTGARAGGGRGSGRPGSRRPGPGTAPPAPAPARPGRRRRAP